MINIENLCAEISSDSGIAKAVEAVSLTIENGETFALVGESGCGKSMTALSILRLLPDNARISDGNVLIDDQEVMELPESKMRNIRGKRISIIFQEPSTSLNPVMTVGDQIAEVICRHTKCSKKQGNIQAIEWLEKVGIPEAQRRVNDYPFQMSGGQKQRVMIAIALAAEPDVVIADEPTTALDVTIQAQILDLLKELQASRNLAILLITHDLAVVSQMADRVGLMYAGQIIEVADSKDFFQKPRHPYAIGLFRSLPGNEKRGQVLQCIRGNVPALTESFTGCRFESRCDHAMLNCSKNEQHLLKFGANHMVRCQLYSEENAAFRPSMSTNQRGISKDSPLEDECSDEVLSVQDLKVWFPIKKGLLQRTAGNVKAVDGVSFAIGKGKTFALVGESGSGKTTVGKAILQLLRQSANVSGNVYLQGKSLNELNGSELLNARKNIQIIFQDPFSSLNPRMRVSEIMEEGVSTLCPELSSVERKSRIERLIDRVGLNADSLAKYPHEFSGGQRQRIAIARALSVEPKIIIADEPTSALDVSVQAQILNLMQEIQVEMGLSYLFITHNFGVVEFLADDIAVMKNGHIVEIGKAVDVLSNPTHEYTKNLLDAVPRILIE